MPQKRMEYFRLLLEHLCMNRAPVFEWHKRFKEGRESVVGMMRGVGGVGKSIH